MHRSQVEVSGGTRTQTQKISGVKAKVSVKTNLQNIVLRFFKTIFCKFVFMEMPLRLKSFVFALRITPELNLRSGAMRFFENFRVVPAN